ncbi:3-deoxy-7-phosphoheptulonate synthase [Phascolarctobacterium succinatutens]
MDFIKKLPDVDKLKLEIPISVQSKRKREEFLKELQGVFEGKVNKKILIIGPCSADNINAVLLYMEKLAYVAEKVYEKLLIIPRIYTSKPRTTGVGYKGLLHRPNIKNHKDSIYNGIFAMRNIHLKVIQNTGLFGADEMLYPDATSYIDDLLSYVAVGARSVENQQHRLVSSGLNIPVGMKNPTSGDVDVLLNAIVAAQSNQSFIYHGWECYSKGNVYAHAILRGYNGINGNACPNYHYENLCNLYDNYMKKNLKNMSVIIDCNHSNSNKHYDEQIRISKEVLHTCKNSIALNGFIKGLMIESYLVDGCQMLDEGIFGKSITDPCLGWEKSEKLIYDIADNLY